MKTTCRQSVVTFVWLLALNGLYSVPGHTQQELHYDETQRLFTLRYIGSDGEQYELVIIPANHIEPYMTIAIHQSRTADLQYGYHLLNRTGPLSEQKLFLFEVDSPLPAELNRVSSPEGWSLNQRFDGSHKRHYWGFHTSDQFALDPGEFISFEFQSQMLPRLMNGRFVGMAPEIPALEATQGNPEVGALVGNTNGVFGGWYQLQVVAPGRSHDELSNPIAGVDILNSDLGDVCQLSWITNPGVCNSLRTKLEQASRAIERGNNEAATGQLLAFLNELEAQHGDGPGKHVNDNAYWLLKVNVEFILERIGDGPAVVRR